MFYSNKVITFCIVITALLSFITGANTQQFQQPQTYQYAFGEGRRRLYNGGGFGGFGGSASAPSASSDFIKFPEDDHRNVPATSLFHGKDDERQEQEMHHVKGPNLEEHDESLNEVSYVPLNITDGVCSYEDFIQRLDPASRADLEMISPRFGGEDVERSRGQRPVPANCIPEMQTIPLKLADSSESKDPTIVVFPSCTRVKRCGGCCNNNLVSCQPIETNTIVFEVIKSQYQGGNRMVFLNKEPVLVEEHTKCKCDCKKKETDCTPFQRYNKSQCLCACINIEDKNKCLREAQTIDKMWDPDTCTCRCREEEKCSTGATFDYNQCRCVEKPGHHTTQSIADRKRLIVKPAIYVPQTPETFYDSGT